MDLPAYHRALNLGFSESEASRIGDDAWENNRQQPTCDSEPEPDYCDVLVAENTRLRAELETERMRLVACSVIALANTPESAASARGMHPDYQSPYCDDVARAVDREIALRAELAECKQDAERYRWLRSNWDRIATSRIYEDGTYYVYSIDMLPFRTPMDLTSLDAAIDAARKGEGEVC